MTQLTGAHEHDRGDLQARLRSSPWTRHAPTRVLRLLLIVAIAIGMSWYLLSARALLSTSGRTTTPPKLTSSSTPPSSQPEVGPQQSEPSSSSPSTTHPTRTLLPLVFTPIPLSRIKPTGWLLNELRTSARGLAGHLHEFYSFVKDSPWVGGDSEYSGLHEAFPYWFNGLVYLSYCLPDGDVEAERLRDQVRGAADEVLKRQARDGWLGPEVGGDRLLWGRWPLLLGFVGLVEADPEAWERRLVPAMKRFIELSHRVLKDRGKGYLPQDPGVSQGDETDWGRVRAADFMIVLQWFLERYPGEMDNILYEEMQMLYDGMLKWEAWYNEDTYIKQDLNDLPENVTDAYFPWLHGVNVGQGLKAPAVVHRFTHNDSLVQTAHDALNWTFRYHGAPSGTVLADERMDGLAPYAGSELCTAVETMYSLSYLYQALGSNNFADLNELAAFNALPTMLTDDHWAHQYMAEPSQPFAKELAQTPFYNSQNLAQTFGLEPNYPCCTVNFPQGWPKFAANSWVRVGDNGLAHVLLSPGSVQTADFNLSCDTWYPFGDRLSYHVESKRPMDLFVRVPEWMREAAGTVAINSAVAESLAPHPVTGLHKILIEPGETDVVLTSSPKIWTTARANHTIAVYRGALLYALEIGSKSVWQSPRHFDTREPFQTGSVPDETSDWTITNATAWNIAIDPSTLNFHPGDTEADLPSQIFSSGAPPPYITAMGCEIDWPLFLDSVPGPPIPEEERTCFSQPYEVRLVPYGSAKLHTAELPTIDLNRHRPA